MERYRRELWPSKSRYERIFGVVVIVALLGAWFTDLVVLGTSTLSFALLGLRALQAGCVLPMVVGAYRGERPGWQDTARLIFAAGVPSFMILIFTLKPTTIGLQGWTMVAIWFIVGIGVRGPFRAKAIAVGASYVLYLGHLVYVVGRLHDSYAKPNELFTVCVLGAFAAVWSPWYAERNEQARLREHFLRRRVEDEVELRREREAALEIAKDAAEDAERDARRAHARAEGESARRARMVADLSHDLRTPMAAIVGLVDVLHESDMTEEQRAQLDIVRTSNRTLLALLDDILDLSRLEAKKVSLEPTRAPLRATLATPALLQRAVAAKKGIALDLVFGAELPEHAMLDTKRVHQLVTNLVGNAVKFTDKGSVTMTVTLRDATPDGGTLRVEVRDTGIGFTAEQRDQLFERFEQADETIAPRFGGTGLGLAICHALTTLMGGTIGTESTPGEGALFWFEIPLRLAAEPAAAEPRAELPRMRILLAEDNPVNRQVLALMLRSLGQDVTCVADGEAAWSALSSEAFDLALLDLRMPKMAGDEVVRRLRASDGVGRRQYVVALTATASDDDRNRFFEAGLDALYGKPIDSAGLRQLLTVEGERSRLRAAAESGVHAR